MPPSIDKHILTLQSRAPFTVDPATGIYTSHVSSPTNLPADPCLTSHGISQSHQLASHIASLDPPIDILYSSAFYRCVQTLLPVYKAINDSRASKSLPAVQAIRPERGLGEYFGLARFKQPRAPTPEILSDHFGTVVDASYQSIIEPAEHGEAIDTMHNRFAYCIHEMISELDKDPNGPETVLLGTHAAGVLCLGRVLTGHMPTSCEEMEFGTGWAGLSRFERRANELESGVGQWSRGKPDVVPEIDWRNGRGVAGGWNCVVNGDCSFLTNGAESPW